MKKKPDLLIENIQRMWNALPNENILKSKGEKEEIMARILLKDLVEDEITLFKGTVVGVAQYLNGCSRCEVQPKGLKDGKPITSEWIDEGQLILIARERGRIKEIKPTGGPVKRPTTFNDPTR